MYMSIEIDYQFRKNGFSNPRVILLYLDGQVEAGKIVGEMCRNCLVFEKCSVSRKKANGDNYPLPIAIWEIF